MLFQQQICINESVNWLWVWVVLHCGQMFLYAQLLSVVMCDMSKENRINPIYYLISLHTALLQF